MSERRAWLERAAAPGLVLLLGAALLVGAVEWLGLASPDDAPAGDLADVLDALPQGSTVLVGFDPDIGTYAEIRPAVRSLLADLLGRGAELAFVSLTPEGRALALAEIGRLRRGGDADGDRLVDVGFIPGAEAGVVALARSLAGEPSAGLGGQWTAAELDAPAAAVIVGGNDLGPRTWVEQLRPRISDLDLVAVVPTILLPETRPYLASGQLSALLATPRDGAAYSATVDGADGAGSPPGAPLALVFGILAAGAWLGTALVDRLAEALRGDGVEAEAR